MLDTCESLLVLLWSSLLEGYADTNKISLSVPAGARLLEATPLSPTTFWSLFGGERAAISELANAATASRATRYLIESAPATLLPALYSLAPQKLSEGVLVLQATDAGNLLRLASELINQYNLYPLELRLPRGSHPAHGFLTGTAQDLHAAQAAYSSSTQVLLPVSSSLRTHFEV